VRPTLPTGTITFLFTDVEGSTRLLHELGAEAYAAVLAEHRRVIRDACAAHRGVEVDTQGDAFFFSFPTASEGLAAAQAAAKALAEGSIQCRIGLHTGTPLVTEEGYVGEDVHFAARVAASGHGGQILVSSSTAALLEPSGSERQALSLVDLGEHRLKDIAEPVSIFQLGEGSFPPLKTISNTNLPRPASSFVGRQRELEEVLSRLRNGARVLSLTGPGGSGKTRLALEAAASLVPDYKAGVFWVGLSSLRDPALVTETIAQTLGAKDGLAELIGEREMLLLLDNLEQVIEAAPELSALVSACPNLNVLVTSRELLRVQGEVEYPVPPLAEPEAVALFCERAQSRANDDIRELCARLDNLPLAVELAAARVKALSPAQILERLSQRLDLFKGGRDADPRQQTLRATIEWSYELLSAEEQQLFARLSVFAGGGCTLEAAEEVCDAGLDTLQSLVEKSLLRFSNGRYWTLETIREFAAAQLAEREPSHETPRRHARWFLALAEEADPALDAGADQAMWLDRLAREHDNLREALTWFASVGEAKLRLRLASALKNFWWVQGHLTEGRRSLEEALESADTVPAVLRAYALTGLGQLAYRQGAFDAAKRAYEESLELYREVGDPTGIARAIGELGSVAAGEEDYERAASLYEESAALFREAGDRMRLASTLGNLGAIANIQGDYDRGRRLSEEALALHREFGAKDDIALVLHNLGRVALHERRHADAAELLRESIALSSELSFKELTAYGLEGLAELAAVDDAERAAELLGAVDALVDEIGVVLNIEERESYERTVEALRAQLGKSEFESKRADGRALELERAIELALETGVGTDS
jgi:predicted ATPase/class 3 adenylate cyclase